MVNKLLVLGVYQTCNLADQPHLITPATRPHSEIRAEYSNPLLFINLRLKVYYAQLICKWFHTVPSHFYNNNTIENSFARRWNANNHTGVTSLCCHHNKNSVGMTTQFRRPRGQSEAMFFDHLHSSAWVA